MRTLDVFRTSVAAAALGFARAASTRRCAAGATREMFGQRLGDFQLTQAKLAQMATTHRQRGLLTYRAAWLRDQGQTVTREAAMAKMVATEGAQQVIDARGAAVRRPGRASGQTVERLYREIRALRIYEGATEVQQLIIGATCWLGLALGLTAGIGWAAGTLILKRNGGMELPATVITGWQLLASALPIGLVALAVDGLPQALPTWPTLGLMLYITLVPTCIGNVAWFAIVGMLPAQLAGLSSILVPVVAMLSGAVIHGEPLGPLQLAAMGCCSGALWLALGRRS
jgi:hypothetical protein